jgi:bacteriorhodopsin
MLKTLRISTVATLVALNEALAQASPATPGAPAAPATADDGGANWLWIILGLAILAGLVWYFMRGRSRTTTAGTLGTSSGEPSNRPNVYDNDKRK